MSRILNNYQDQFKEISEDFFKFWYDEYRFQYRPVVGYTLKEYKSKNFNIIYKDINKDFKLSYEKKLEKIIKEKKIKKLSFFEIEDKFFEKKIINIAKKNSLQVNQIKSPMFLIGRDEFKNYLSKNKRPFMANFYKIVRTKTNLLMNKNGTPKGNKWSFDEENRKKLPSTIKIPEISKVKDTKDTSILKKFINLNFKDHPGNTDKFWFPTVCKVLCSQEPKGGYD